MGLKLCTLKCMAYVMHGNINSEPIALCINLRKVDENVYGITASSQRNLEMLVAALGNLEFPCGNFGAFSLYAAASSLGRMSPWKSSVRGLCHIGDSSARALRCSKRKSAVMKVLSWKMSIITIDSNLPIVYCAAILYLAPMLFYHHSLLPLLCSLWSRTTYRLQTPCFKRQLCFSISYIATCT